MARFNEILVGRYNRALQKLFGMKGNVPSPQLGSEITPTISFPLSPDNRYLESWETFAAFAVVTGAAANVASFRFRNPNNSNVIAVILKLYVTSVLGDLATIGNATDSGADLTTIVTPGRVDRRGRPGATLIFSNSVNTSALGTQIMIGRVPANSTYDFIQDSEQQLIVSPNHQYDFQSAVNAQQLGLGLLWRERFLEDSERS